jgi:hypothetical protein
MHSAIREMLSSFVAIPTVDPGLMAILKKRASSQGCLDSALEVVVFETEKLTPLEVV